MLRSVIRVKYKSLLIAVHYVDMTIPSREEIPTKFQICHAILYMNYF